MKKRKASVRASSGGVGRPPFQYKCRHCAKKFKTRGASQLHAILCHSNPNRQLIIQKISNTQYLRGSTGPRVHYAWYTLKCARCSKQYSVYVSDNNYSKQKYTKFCSIYCRQYRVQNTIQYRLRASMIGKTSWKVHLNALRQRAAIVYRQCPQCGSIFKCKYNSRKQYCSEYCTQIMQLRTQQTAVLQQKIREHHNEYVSYFGWGKTGY